MQVTTMPPVETQTRDTLTGADVMQKTPEMRRVPFSWTNRANAGVGHKLKNLAKPSEQPSTAMPALLVTPPRNAQFGAVAENSAAPDHEAAPMLGWRGVQQAVTCAVLVALLLVLLRALDRYRPFLRFGRRQRARTHVVVTCTQLRRFREEQAALGKGSLDSPPSYFDCADAPLYPDSDKEMDFGDDNPPGYSYVTFTACKDKDPTLPFLEGLSTQRFQEELGHDSDPGQERPSFVYINMPNRGKGKGDRRSGNVVIDVDEAVRRRTSSYNIGVNVNRDHGELEVMKCENCPLTIKFVPVGPNGKGKPDEAKK